MIIEPTLALIRAQLGFRIQVRAECGNIFEGSISERICCNRTRFSLFLYIEHSLLRLWHFYQNSFTSISKYQFLIENKLTLSPVRFVVLNLVYLLWTVQFSSAYNFGWSYLTLCSVQIKQIKKWKSWILSECLSIHLSFCLSVRLFVHNLVSTSVLSSICLFVNLLSIWPKNTKLSGPS